MVTCVPPSVLPVLGDIDEIAAVLQYIHARLSIGHTGLVLEHKMLIKLVQLPNIALASRITSSFDVECYIVGAGNIISSVAIEIGHVAAIIFEIANSTEHTPHLHRIEQS